MVTPAPRTSVGFFNRPWWRDWLLGGVLIALGFLIFSPGHRVVNTIGLATSALGAAIILTAVAHAAWSLVRRNRAGDVRKGTET